MMSVLQFPTEPSEAAVDAWLGSLPTNPGECCRILSEGLQVLNAGDLATDVRFRALERLKPMIFLQSQRLMQLYLGREQGGDGKARKLAMLGVQFIGELGKSYLALARLAKDSLEADDEYRVQLVYRAMECFDLYALRLAQVFESPSSSFWARICELFALAETMVRLDWRPDGTRTAAGPGLSIENLFCRLLAFQRAAPNQLALPEIQRLHDLLGEFGALMAIGKEAEQAGRFADFYVDLAAPTEARPLLPDERGEAHPARRYLYCKDLRAKLILQSQPSIVAAERLKPAFSAHLQIRLGGVPLPSQETQSRNAVLIPQLADLVAHLSILEVRGSQADAWEGGGISLEILPMDFHEDALPPKTSVSKSSGTFLPGRGSNSAGLAPAARSRGEYPCRVWRAEAPGYYLLESSGTKLGPGMLVAINTDNRIIQLGVIAGGAADVPSAQHPFELLASEPVPVKVYSDAAPLKAHKAVLAKLTVAKEGGQGLFAQALRLRSGESFTLEREGMRKRCKVLRIRESSKMFFEYEVAVDGELGTGETPTISSHEGRTE